MKKILVAYDFSPSSQNTLLYAAELSYIYGAELIVFHAYLPTRSEPFAEHMLRKALGRQEEALGLSYFIQGQRFLPEHLRNTLSIRFHLEMGMPSEEILVMCKKENPDLLLMGIRGGHLEHHKRIGSTANAVVQRCEIPVMLIPLQANFTQYRDIYYLTAYGEEELEVLDLLLDFGATFKAQLHCLDIYDNSSSIHNSKSTILHTAYARDIARKKLNFVGLGNRDIMDKIQDYTRGKGVDLMVLLKHQKQLIGEFLENQYWAGKKSNVNNSLEASPLLVIPMHKESIYDTMLPAKTVD